jgi:SAM-dependent methyltransferase
MDRTEQAFRTVLHQVFDDSGPMLWKQVTEQLPAIRFRMNIDDLAARAQQGARIVDIGAGLSTFAPVLQVLGAKVALVDDFAGGGGVLQDNPDQTKTILERCEKILGLEVFRQNLLTTDLPFSDNSVDVVTSFHCFEHFHHSPRLLMSEIRRILRPDASFILCTPNAVNLRKRISVVFGRTNLPSLEEWYYEGEPTFRGHVREATVSDLVRICTWNDLIPEKVIGANIIGKEGPTMKKMPKTLVPIIDFMSDNLLPLWPTLCSDIFVLARKPMKMDMPG